MYTFSKNLQYLMEAKNINKNQLAKILSIPSPSIGRWVNGKVTDPTLSKLLILSSFFETSIDDLVKRNLKVQDEIIGLYKEEYIYLPLFEWDGEIYCKREDGVKNCRIPKLLMTIESTDNLFSIKHHSEYYSIYPKKSILIFSKDVCQEKNCVILVKNKLVNNRLIVKLTEKGYIDILTNKKIDIEQFGIEGILVNLILDNVFLNLPE